MAAGAMTAELTGDEARTAASEARASGGVERVAPTTVAEAADALGAAGGAVELVGSGSKRAWGGPIRDATLEVSTAGLRRVVAHTPADLSAVLEAGVPLADAQAVFAEAGLMLALDSPLGPGSTATVGGVVATGDTGPLRHRFGGPRDLVLGMTAVLGDGTVIRSGGTVIKNVAGYDLGKLFAGSFGTLGFIAAVAVRLHPLPRDRRTVVAARDSAEELASAAAALAHAPLELDALDVAWSNGRGVVLAAVSGAASDRRASDAAALVRHLGPELMEDDEALWAAQRAGQRSAEGMVVKVSGLPTDLPRVVAAVEARKGALVGRAGMGLSWLTLPVVETGVDEVVADLRMELDPLPCAVLDTPVPVAKPWPRAEPGLAHLLGRVKERFDPRGVCNPGREPWST
jgi:glycolate oxidase FAD binding subunit